MSRQLSFDWPARVSLGPDDFFVSTANAQAYAMITDHDGWPEGKLALIGPPGSGKSHLARVWQHLTGAVIMPARDIDPGDICPPPATHVVIEDMEALPHGAEERLFHLHNHLRASGGRLLLTADRAPSRWHVALPDLASRMQAATVVRVDDPDDRLLAAVLMKLFADRQIAPAPDVVTYLASRIERSFAAAAATVDALDAAALAQGRDITRAFARAVLDPEVETGIGGIMDKNGPDGA